MYLEEDGSTPARIEQGGILFLPAQFHIRSLLGKEILPGQSLQTPVKAQAVRCLVALPTLKVMAHRGTELVGCRSDGHKTDATPSIALLQHFPQIGRKNIRFDERITQISDAYRTRAVSQFVQSTVKRNHSP